LRRHCHTGSGLSGIRLPPSLRVGLGSRAGHALGAPQLLLELLVAVLQLLDQSGEPADFLLEPIDPQHEIRGGKLRQSHRCRPIGSRALRCVCRESCGGRSDRDSG
jgi:hypothetical protein